ncbi:hypothetical protein PR202_gb03535 [Eleusine coracana subsp. coracana]|uniref:Retrotransposon gag domain-containing protein n=1 Tax=Eleusine coracana subsp. coracana TaxID=191504 RepID=A0AAV5E292_ELECO|nr:hypothetical protein PR202_gb03535 [Eleusine coracana subsp. coracana]
MPTNNEINGIKAYVPRLRIARWQKGFKLVPIEKYDGQTNPREWLQPYITVIRSVGGDSYVMANYLPICLDPTVRIWLTTLPEESITSWGDLNKKLIESFQATCNRPGNHFDLTRIKQKTDEPLRDYIKQFCAKKTEIPNVPDDEDILHYYPLGRRPCEPLNNPTLLSLGGGSHLKRRATLPLSGLVF